MKSLSALTVFITLLFGFDTSTGYMRAEPIVDVCWMSIQQLDSLEAGTFNVPYSLRYELAERREKEYDTKRRKKFYNTIKTTQINKATTTNGEAEPK